MVRSMYAAVAGLRAHQSKMDVIGNNIANVNTYGYKTGRATFQESIYQTTQGSSDGTLTYGGRNPAQIGYGSTLGSVDLIFSTSSYAPTGKATDCMIDGNGFFVVGQKFLGDDGIPNASTADAADGQLNQLELTRVGNFNFDGDGFLVDTNGNVVYGFMPDDAGVVETSGDDVKLKPIRVPLDDKKNPKKFGNVTIDSTGVITGTDADTKQVVTIGVIGIANVPNPNALEKTQGPYYKIVSNTGEVVVYKPSDGATGKLRTSGLEMANVDLANEFSEMITTQRGFQANGRIITVTDEMLQELINLKR